MIIGSSNLRTLIGWLVRYLASLVVVLQYKLLIVMLFYKI